MRGSVVSLGCQHKIYLFNKARKIDKSELIKDVEPYPDAYQKERAERFGVCQKAIWQALKKLGLTYKKNSTPSESRRKRPASISTKNTTV
ncbi:IS630 transposase-related protein [Symbiopectobacterium sp. RP]|uniref:IS630 transposase-related protein n=1 Tax=Symbiopectobacterium sp. RP TaxID=3248553 RepID=UPI003D2E03CF